MIDTPELPIKRIPRAIEESFHDNKNCEAIVLWIGPFSYVLDLPSFSLGGIR
jgi:hypothetical protein